MFDVQELGSIFTIVFFSQDNHTFKVLMYQNDPYFLCDSTLINIIILNGRAARYGKLNAVRKLVSMTAKVDATNINGQTALHIGKHSKTT